MGHACVRLAGWANKASAGAAARGSLRYSQNRFGERMCMCLPGSPSPAQPRRVISGVFSGADHQWIYYSGGAVQVASSSTARAAASSVVGCLLAFACRVWGLIGRGRAQLPIRLAALNQSYVPWHDGVRGRAPPPIDRIESHPSPGRIARSLVGTVYGMRVDSASPKARTCAVRLFPIDRVPNTIPIGRWVPGPDTYVSFCEVTNGPSRRGMGAGFGAVYPPDLSTRSAGFDRVHISCRTGIIRSVTMLRTAMHGIRRPDPTMDASHLTYIYSLSLLPDLLR